MAARLLSTQENRMNADVLTLARMRSYEEANITLPSPSIVVDARSMNHE